VTLSRRALRIRRTGLVLGPVFLIILLLVPLSPALSPAGHTMIAIAALMTTWWLTEAVPIAVTSLVPMLAYPLLGIMPMKDATLPYANHLVYLFLGGFVLAIAIEESGLHRRIALLVIRVFGARPTRLVLGFMCATAFLSMWINNTSATLMMLPVALAVTAKVMAEVGADDAHRHSFGMALLLGTAYAASIGGVGTLIGTAPNVLMAGLVVKMYPTAPEISFLQWMLLALPVVAVMIPVAWVLLIRVIPPIPLHRIHMHEETVRASFAAEMRAMGRMSGMERRVLVVFLATAALWMFRAPIEIGSLRVPGITDLVPWVTDSTVAMAAALVLMVVPTRVVRDEQNGWNTLVSWSRVQTGIPWGVLLLFGGGFALADGLEKTGVTLFLGQQIASLTMLPPFVMVLVICTLMTFLTELTSNTATASVLLPVMAGTAIALGQNPLLFMLPATISASFAFMLPVGTPPNAIVYASGYLTLPQMARAGFLLNLAGILVVGMLMYMIGLGIFDITPGALPAWLQR
jgi:solute carrier family 13 (sodium-dependent dicarboxylate transporter), member 2/3/5